MSDKGIASDKLCDRLELREIMDDGASRVVRAILWGVYEQGALASYDIRLASSTHPLLWRTSAPQSARVVYYDAA